MKIKSIIFSLLFVALLSGCVQSTNYHSYVMSEFETSSTDELTKKWTPKDNSEAKSTADSNIALSECESLLYQLKPRYALKITAQEIILSCMDKKGFQYVTEEVLVVN